LSVGDWNLFISWNLDLPHKRHFGIFVRRGTNEDLMQENSFQLVQINGWSYYCLPGFTEQGIRHGFFTGRSPDTRNESDMAQFGDALESSRVIVLDQEHGDEVHVIAAGEQPLRGDGIIVIEKNVVAVIKTADCLPVIIVDPTFPMAAVVHAGWRGTVKKITAKAVQTMSSLGAHSGSMTAMLGPSIGPCCYEVGNEVVDAFREAGFTAGSSGKRALPFTSICARQTGNSFWGPAYRRYTTQISAPFAPMAFLPPIAGESARPGR
jgi:YfiH family protein